MLDISNIIIDRFTPTTPRLILTATLLLCVGCTTIKDVRFEDKGLELPSLRISRALTESMRLEVEHARVKGSDTQVLANRHELIHLDDTRVRGPAQLDSSFELRAVKVGLGMDVLTRDSVELKVGAGVSEVDAELGFKDQTQRHTFSHSNMGAYGRFTIVLPISASVAVSGHTGINKFFDESTGHMIDSGVRLLWRPSRSLEFYTGWFDWDYRNEEMKSDIQIDAEGLAYGMQVVF